MNRSASTLLSGLALLLALAPIAAAGDLPELKFEKYELSNGLDVILHEDHTLPTVTVNVWYHVGSKNEKPGRTGFAHLFEHMMFQGSENHMDDYFTPLQKIGGAVNGSTTEDRTNYWENVPANYLELALWLEADRMGFLPPAMTQESFENQQDVVSNEKRQGENEPYAKAYERMIKLMFPYEHPYHHSVIGSLDDLAAASLDDVKDFFRLYYAPNNASLCIGGDFDPAEAKRWVEKYFAAIPAGLPVDRIESWIPRLDGVRRAVDEDQVELPRVYMEWHVPARYTPGDAEFDLLASIMSAGKTSRLYKSLVYEQEIAQDVEAYHEDSELSGIFGIQATARPGVAIADLEAAVDAEVAKLLKKGITKDELKLAQIGYEAGFVRRLQRVGGFGGKADRLNNYNVFTGDPGFLQADLARYRDATVKGINAFAREYIDMDRRGILHIIPQGGPMAAEVAVDRSVMPGASADVSFGPPTVQRATLSNGLELYLVERHELPLVQFNLTVKSGWASDPKGKPGTASLTAELLDEGTRAMDALEIAEAARGLGAQLGTGSFFDGSSLTLNVLRSRMDEGLALLTELVLSPSFPDDELARLRKDYLGRIQQEQSQPQSTLIKLVQKRLFGEDHPYAQPFTGTGTPESLARIQRADLVAYYEANYKPNNSAIIVVGDVDMAVARATLEKAFGGWERGEVKRPLIPAARSASDARVVLVDRPGAQQSMIMVSHLGLNRGDPDYLAFDVMNTALGGHFGARINMNLREDKGYTYGCYSQVMAFREAGMFGAMAPVHTQFTSDAIGELLSEFSAIRDTRPVTDEELRNSKNRLVMGFPQQFQSLGGIAEQLSSLILNDLPVDEWQTYMDRVEGMSSAEITRVAREHIRPDDFSVIVVGDRSRIEAGIRGLGLGEVLVIDAGEI